MKQKISAEKLPRLSEESPVYTVDKKVAMEKGMRASLEMEDGTKLTIYNLNKHGQTLLTKTLPTLFSHMGMDLVDQFTFIL